MKQLRFGIVFTYLKVAILLFITVIMLYPIIHITAVSLSSETYIMKNMVGIIPRGLNIKAYRIVLSDSLILRAYVNTIVYVTTGTLLSLLVTTSGAFSLSRDKMPLNKFFTLMIVFTMFFGGGMIPTYLLVKNLGMINTIWAVILPGCVSAWFVLLMRSFFYSIPKELEESCKIDGMNDLAIFWYIFLPLSKPALATFALFYAVGNWNSFFGPFLYLTSPKKFPLQVILRSLLIANEYRLSEMVGMGDQMVMPEAIKYATVMVSTLPILLIYPFAQKYFVKGIMIGAVKG